MISNNLNTAFYFRNELSRLLPSMENNLAQEISIKFFNAKNMEEFEHDISAILPEQSDTKDKIMHLGRTVLCRAHNEKQKALSAAKCFIEHLIHSHEEIENVDGKLANLMELLSSEIEPIACLAWNRLDVLATRRSFVEYFSGGEKLSELLALLEFSATRWISSQRARARRLNTYTPLERLVDLLCDLSRTDEKTWIGRAVKTLTDLFQDLLTAQHSSLSAPRMLDLITLMHSKNDWVSAVSLKLQSHLMSQSPLLIQVLSKKNTELSFRKLRDKFKESDDEEYRSAILTYLHQVIAQFPEQANYKNVYQLFFIADLPALLEYVTINESAIIPFCNYLSTCGKIDDVDFSAQDRTKLLALLQHQVGLYIKAKAQTDVSDEYIELQQQRVVHLAHSLTLLAHQLVDGGATTLCTILTNMLADTSPRMVVFAIRELANLCHLRTSPPIGYPCIRPLVDLLDAQDEKIVDAALRALNVMMQCLRYVQSLLRTSGFEKVRGLLVSPSDQYMGNALLFWGECIQARRQIDDTDLSYIQNALIPALDGKHRKPAFKTLSGLLMMEQFPLPLASTLIKRLMSLQKDEQDDIVELVLKCLQVLTARGLVAEIFQAGALEPLSARIDKEDDSDLLTKACVVLRSLLLSGFKDEALRRDLLCFTSTLLDKKSALLRGIAYAALLGCAKDYPSCLFEISHVSFVKVVKLIGSENEDTVKNALSLSSILCELPFNYQENILETLLDHYRNWIQNGNAATKYLATEGIAAICVCHPAMHAFVIQKNIVNVLRNCAFENLRCTVGTLTILTSLSNLPTARGVLYKPEFVDLSIFCLKHENKTVKKLAIRFIANMRELWSDMDALHVCPVLWKQMVLEEVDESTYKDGLAILSKHMPRNEIIHYLQISTARLRSALILALNLLSRVNPSPTPTTPPSIPASPFKSLYQPYVKTKMSDIALKIGQTSPLHCHKVVLAAQSDYFKTLFLSDFNESNLSTLVINDVDPEHFEPFTKFLYEQIFHYTTPKAAIALHNLAVQYMVPSLEAQCELEIVNHLAPDSVAEIFDWVSTGQSSLQEPVMCWMMNHYSQLPKALQEYIQQDDVWPTFYELLIN